MQTDPKDMSRLEKLQSMEAIWSHLSGTVMSCKNGKDVLMRAKHPFSAFMN